MTKAGNNVLLRAKGLSLRFGDNDKAVLSGVDIEVAEGEMHAVIGPNGAGKSTCIRCLAGVLGGWSGTVELAGRPLGALSRRELARLVCYLPQVQETPPAFTVWDYVGMGRYAHGSFWGGLSATDIGAVERALAAAGVLELRERLLPTLSGGERQMAAIAAGLAQGARLFILDEPATFLDPLRQERLIELLTRLNRETGLAVLMVTHDINAAILFTHRTLALREGRAVYDGPSEGLASAGILHAVYGMDFAFLPLPDGGRYAVAETMIRAPKESRA